MFSSAS